MTFPSRSPNLVLDVHIRDITSTAQFNLIYGLFQFFWLVRSYHNVPQSRIPQQFLPPLSCFRFHPSMARIPYSTISIEGSSIHVTSLRPTYPLFFKYPYIFAHILCHIFWIDKTANSANSTKQKYQYKNYLKYVSVNCINYL